MLKQTVMLATSVRNLIVIFESGLTMKTHVSSIANIKWKQPTEGFAQQWDTLAICQ